MSWIAIAAIVWVVCSILVAIHNLAAYGRRRIWKEVILPAAGGPITILVSFAWIAAGTD